MHQEKQVKSKNIPAQIINDKICEPHLVKKQGLYKVKKSTQMKYLFLIQDLI